ncbi:MAG: hypothetical protein Ct9H300mP28_36000 [Pseudomonadota bacterium]|nr:MAG: hypothetical protein Ct9H300mP28_36000 [Pseudomonadota bacterium]
MGGRSACETNAYQGNCMVSSHAPGKPIIIERTALKNA